MRGQSVGPITAIVACAVACGGDGSDPAPDAGVDAGFVGTVTVTVPAGAGEGPVSDLYRLNVHLFGWYGPLQPILDELPVGHFRIDLGFEVLLPSTSADDLATRLESSNIAEGTALIEADGGSATWMVGMMPRYLSTCAEDETLASGWPGWARCPPADPDEWGRLVGRIAAYARDHGVSPRLEIWNEPDGAFWQGTRTEYFELYAAAAAGAREAHPTLAVGGPAISDLYAGVTTLPIEDGFLREFIAWASAHGLPEVGLSRTPIDFLVWHAFDTLPSFAGAQVAGVRSWLAEAGYPPETALMIDEWNLHVEIAPDADEPSGERIDSEYNAAYYAASTLAYRRRGIDVLAFASLGDNLPGPPEFHGGQGLLTTSGIRKPSYEAARLLGALEGEEVDPDVDGGTPFVSAVASRSAEATRILVTNFVPEPIPYAEQTLIHGAGSRDVLVEIGATGADRLLDVLEGRSEPADLGLSAAATALVERARQAFLDASRFSGPIQVRLVVRGLPEGARSLRRLLVDSTRSNSFRAYQKALADGNPESQAVTAARAADGLVEVDAATVDGPDLDVSFELERFAVTMIELR